ncbi:Winged helix-like DNA-binding domain superfamily [Sesbania bispinosa]|nr:Winged helix-like DNA-binding domain superfamily [Sesbania bispinosa]
MANLSNSKIVDCDGEDHKKLAELELEDEECFSYAMQLCNSVVLPMALKSATELGVFDVLQKAGRDAKLSSKEIASKLSCNNPQAAAMSQLKDAIREGGIPFNRVHGTHAFEYPSLDSRFNQLFNTAMINHTTLIMKKVLECYKGFEGIKRLVDVGGGLGININMITSKYPHIQGINFDLPHVIQHAPSYPGVEHVGGDMFESVPKGDAIFMKWILHDWSDEHCLKLLKNCYDAIPNDGKVIVVEAVLPIIPENNAAWKCVSQTDVLMMTQNPGGKERSEQQFMELATAAGFSGIKYGCRVRTFWVMEFFK